MTVSDIVRHKLSHFESATPGEKTNLARIMMHGRLAGTGKMVILPVDQGFEHGPIRSFGENPAGYDPDYHFRLAIDAGVSAFAAPLGLLEARADYYAGQVPLILKMNSANSLIRSRGSKAPDQAITATVKDAVRLGCVGVGLTTYPGSDQTLEIYEEVREVVREAKTHGLAVILWSYVRGGDITKQGETAIDTISYGAHMACLMGAHIVKCKIPSDFIEQDKNKTVIEDQDIAIKTKADRVAHVVKSCFDGRRMVIFSGGAAKDKQSVLDDAGAIAEGGGNGSIIGRNAFQRPKSEGIDLLQSMMDVYAGE